MSKPQPISEATKTVKTTLTEQMKIINAQPIVHASEQQCFRDCKECNGTGFIVIDHKKTGDVNRWQVCPRKAEFDAAVFWLKNEKMYGLDGIKLEGKPAQEIRFPDKPMQGQEAMHKLCAKIMKEDPPTSWGMLLGAFGRGKSHYLVAMVNEFRLRHRGAHYCQAHEIVTKLQDTFDTNAVASSVRTFFEAPPFLAVDELDAVKWSEWTGQELFAIFEARRLLGRSTIFATNASIQELQERSEILSKLMSRIAGNGEIVAVEGVDHRMVK